ncbi:MAG TPA: hypothetical protein VJO99_07615 [Burkholderiaceae bacterium]|nr:hypothetical protein [Burkholderiaceae bacterium]
MALTTVLLTASGCASTEGADTKQTAQPTELIYRTGSNIPIREKTPMTAEEKAKQTEDSQRALQQMQATGAGKPKL